MTTVSAGLRLGRYEIRAPLGAGGMGEVYRALDTRLGREVAVKVLPAGLTADPQRLARFEQEARAVGMLEHPNILVVHDVGTHDDAPFLVTELLVGQTVRELLRHGPLAPRRAAELAAQAAQGLAAAHDKGVVHRDLKPENLFLTRDGTLKILDFGLAKLLAVDAESATVSHLAGPDTGSGVVLGTLGYLSPEQARGQATDERTDQFALGAVLYELLAGEPAFRGANAAETLSAVLRDEPEPLARRAPLVPAPLRWIVERCLAKSADERYASTRDLARELGDVVGHWSEVATSTAGGVAAEAVPAPPRWPRRLLVPLAALLLGLAAGAASVRWLGRGEPAPPVTLSYLTYSGADGTPAVSPDGKTIAFTSRRDGRSRIWLKQFGGGGEAPLTNGEDDLPRFSPDGGSILFVHREGERRALYRMALVGGEPRKILDDVLQADWSPDGRHIGFVRDFSGQGGNASLAIAELDGSGARDLYRAQSANLLGPRFSPDGRWLAAASGGQSGVRGGYVLVPVGGGKPRLVPGLLRYSATSAVEWSGGGEAFFYLQAESVAAGPTGAAPALLIRHDLGSGRARAVAWVPGLGAIGGIVAPGRVVFASDTSRETLAELRLGARSGEAARALARGAASDRQPVYSPDGRWLAFSSNRSGALDLWAIERASGALRRLTDDPADDWDPGFTPDGRHLLWSSNRSGNFEIWMADVDGSHARQVTHGGGDAENPTATPDGWIVYNAGEADKSGVWKIRPDGSHATRLVAGVTNTPEVSPDGRYVAYRVDYVTNTPRVRVARVADGAPVPFEIAVRSRGPGSSGRARWLPGGGALAFVTIDESGAQGIVAQDFVPGRDTAASRRTLDPGDVGTEDESFGISPDGVALTVARVERVSSLLLADHVPGALPPRH